MRRWLKTGIRIVLSLVLLLLLVWGGLTIYVQRNQDVILANIRSQLNDHISGKLDIEKMETDLVHGFPGISVTLYNVRLTDSLFEKHHYPLLQAGKIFVNLDVRSVMQKNIRIKRLEITEGSVNFFTDSNGVNNARVFRERNTNAGGDKELRLEALSFANIDLMIRDLQKEKLYRFRIHNLSGNMQYKGDVWLAAISTRTTVHDMAFNTGKGSFLKNKTIRSSFNVLIDRKQKTINIPEEVFHLDNEKVHIAAAFGYATLPVQFTINIRATKVALSSATSMLTPAIASKLKPISLKNNIDVDASIAGRFLFRDTPVVVVNWLVKNNTLGTPVGDIENASFKGSFSNERIKGMGHGDRNSMIRLYGFKGSWENIPFRADSVIITDLISPVLQGRFVSSFPLTRLNDIIGGRTFAFKQGNASLDLLYKGGIKKDDTALAYVYGTINATNATVLYKPRNLSFANTAASIKFQGRDLLINNVRLSQGSSVINMNGSLKNFLSLYYTDPAKMVLDWNIKSDRIDLTDFMSFLGKRNANVTGPVPDDRPGTTTKNAVAKISGQMDKVLDQANVKINLAVGDMVYQKFAASQIHAAIWLRNTAMVLDNVYLKHAGGLIAASGSIGQGAAVNPFSLNANIDGVDVQQFFTAFGNFNQDAITDKNVRGTLLANANITGNVLESGKIEPYSLQGTVSFDLVNGRLVKFDPIERIGKYIFRNRNLSDVAIRKMKNTLILHGDKVTIQPMYIESSAVNVGIDGVYAFTKGTKINIDVPLRNPKKDELIDDEELRQQRGMKGIVVHLTAVDGTDGKVKIELHRKRQD